MAASESKESVRAAAILTASYVASTAVQVGNSSRANINVAFTLASLTSLELIVEFSNDNSTWTQLPFLAITGGTASVTPGVYQFLPAGFGTSAVRTVLQVDVCGPLMRVSVKGTGTLTASSCAITIDEGNSL